jgi:hypothetical protein
MRFKTSSREKRDKNEHPEVEGETEKDNDHEVNIFRRQTRRGITKKKKE